MTLSNQPLLDSWVVEPFDVVEHVFKITPNGSMNRQTGATAPSFTITFNAVIQQRSVGHVLFRTPPATEPNAAG